jgi:hypothetical protein
MEHHPAGLDELDGVIPHGEGSAACTQLVHHQGLGYLIDSRVVGANVAGQWVPSLSGGGGAVTVCVLARSHVNSYTVVAARSGHAPLVVTRGDFTVMAQTMTHLGELQEQQPATMSGAPFTCPHPGDDNVALPGSATLPEGATAARICTDGGWYYPSMPLTTGIDVLIRKINGQPLTYNRGSSCSGTSGAHGYVMVFEYPQGTRTVEADFCGWIGVGPVQRTDTYPSVGDRFLAALSNQESTSGETAPAPCSGQRSGPSGRGDLTHVVAARFCKAGSTGAGVRVTGAKLKRLTIATGRWDGSYTRIEGACPRPGEGWPHLMLSDAWHETFSVTLRCRRLRFWEVVFPGITGRVVHPVLINGVQGLIRGLAGAN